MVDFTPEELEYELWAVVPEYDHYIVSTLGRLYNRHTERFVKGRRRPDGSIRVVLSRDGRKTDTYLHIVVYSSFHYTFVPGSKVRHIDGDKSNNRLTNLDQFYLKREHPSQFTAKHGDVKAVRIIETGEMFPSVEALAHAIDGDLSAIYKVLNGKRRHHLGFTFEYIFKK